MMAIPELLILIFIGLFVWLLFKKIKIKIKRPSSENNSKAKSRQTKFCSECGVPLEQNDRFCPICGTKVIDVNEPKKKQSQIKKDP